MTLPQRTRLYLGEVWKLMKKSDFDLILLRVGSILAIVKTAIEIWKKSRS